MRASIAAKGVCWRDRINSLSFLLVLTWSLPLFESPALRAQITNELPKQERWFQYTNEVNEDVPLSIHAVRVDRSHHDFEFCTTLGKSNTLGMAVVSEQVKWLPADCGQPLAAINGDFYEKSEKYL